MLRSPKHRLPVRLRRALTIVVLALCAAFILSLLSGISSALVHQLPHSFNPASLVPTAVTRFFERRTAPALDPPAPFAGEVTLTATAGTASGSFTTLKGAFDAINAGTHQGVIAISINADTAETASAVLNASGSGSASYTSISIQPSGGATRTISGAITAGSPLIDLNGADNVTIDGLNTSGNALIISNTTASATAGTSTIRFIADATSNTIQNCTISGSETLTTSGTIFFSTGTTTGNDNNIINNNSIGPAGANLPTNGVFASGTSAAISNSGVQITNNKIFDFFGGSSAGINVAGGNTDWTISGNSLYQT